MKKIIAFITLIAAAGTLYAQDAASVAMPFSVKPRDMQTLATGGTYALKNVAARPFDASKFDVNASYTMWGTQTATKTNDINVAVSGKIAGKLGLLGAFSMDNGSAYDIIGEGGAASGTFTPKDMLINGGVSYQIIPVLSVGATVKYMTSALAKNKNYSAIGADVMLAGSFGNAKVLAGVTNLGGKVKAADNSEYSIPMAVTAAGNYCAAFTETSALNINAQIDYFLKGGLRAGFGAEYGFKDMIFVRAGYNYGGKSVIPSFVSAGLGAKFAGIGINVAALFGNAVSTTLQFGVSYSF